jgi:hypothetical protein
MVVVGQSVGKLIVVEASEIGAYNPMTCPSKHITPNHPALHASPIIQLVELVQYGPLVLLYSCFSTLSGNGCVVNVSSNNHESRSQHTVTRLL